jgi:hypothetical protein
LDASRAITTTEQIEQPVRHGTAGRRDLKAARSEMSIPGGVGAHERRGHTDGGCENFGRQGQRARLCPRRQPDGHQQTHQRPAVDDGCRDRGVLAQRWTNPEDRFAKLLEAQEQPGVIVVELDHLAALDRPFGHQEPQEFTHHLVDDPGHPHRSAVALGLHGRRRRERLARRLEDAPDKHDGRMVRTMHPVPHVARLGAQPLRLLSRRSRKLLVRRTHGSQQLVICAP